MCRGRGGAPHPLRVVNRFDTIPSKPSLQACRNTVAPCSSVCSLRTIAAQSVDVLQASVGVTVGTICWISFVFAQARIVTEQRGAIGTDDLAGIAHSERSEERRVGKE